MLFPLPSSFSCCCFPSSCCFHVLNSLPIDLLSPNSCESIRSQPRSPSCGRVSVAAPSPAWIRGFSLVSPEQPRALGRDLVSLHPNGLFTCLHEVCEGRECLPYSPQCPWHSAWHTGGPTCAKKTEEEKERRKEGGRFAEV